MNSQNKLIEQLTSKVESEFFSHGNLNLHYIKTGKGNPLILLHGATIGWGQWASNIDDLAKFYTVYVIDLPGAGASTKVDFRKHPFKKIFVDPLIHFINDQRLKEVNIVGHSTGGLIAIHLVSTLPQVKNVVLVNSVGLGKKTPLPFRLLSIPGFASLMTKILIGNSKKKLKSFLQEPLYNKQSVTNAFLDYVYESINVNGWLGPLKLISTMTSLGGIKDKFLAVDLIKKNNKKILLIWGQDDKTFDLSEIKENIKPFSNIELVIMEKTGHVPNIEEHQKFNQIILKFLKNDIWR